MQIEDRGKQDVETLVLYFLNCILLCEDFVEILGEW